MFLFEELLVLVVSLLQKFLQYIAGGCTRNWRFPEKNLNDVEKHDLLEKSLNGIDKKEESEKTKIYKSEKERLASSGIDSIKDIERESRITDDIEKLKIDQGTKECPNCKHRYDKKKICVRNVVFFTKSL
jgi:hypothetical protein